MKLVFGEELLEKRFKIRLAQEFIPTKCAFCWELSFWHNFFFSQIV